MAETKIAVHGLDVLPFPGYPGSEYAINPDLLPEIIQKGSGTEYSANRITGRLYVTVPTPTLLDNTFVSLIAISIFYETSYASISNVAIYHGKEVVHERSVSWTGNHHVVDGFNTLHFSPIEISAGIAVVIDLKFDFPPPTATIPRHDLGLVRFSSVVATFEGRGTVLARMARALWAAIFGG